MQQDENYVKGPRQVGTLTDEKIAEANPAEVVFGLTDGLIIGGKAFYSEAHMNQFAQEALDHAQQQHREAFDRVSDALKSSGIERRRLQEELEIEKAKPATLAQSPVTKPVLEKMLENIRKAARPDEVYEAQIKFLSNIIFEFERKVMNTPLPAQLAMKDKEMASIKYELGSYKAQTQYLANDRKAWIESYLILERDYKKLREEVDKQNSVNEEIDERRGQEVNDLYCFTCEVARLRKIPEGAYITKEEGEQLNAVITHAKGLVRKYDE